MFSAAKLRLSNMARMVWAFLLASFMEIRAEIEAIATKVNNVTATMSSTREYPRLSQNVEHKT